MFLMQVGEFGWCVCRVNHGFFRPRFEFHDDVLMEFFTLMDNNSITDKETAEAKLKELEVLNASG